MTDARGTLCGTTQSGGGGVAIVAGCRSIGYRRVFKLPPPAAGQSPSTETVLHRLRGGFNDGAAPVAGLIADATGAL